MSSPLTELLKEKNEWKWGEEELKAFETLKNIFVKDSIILALPKDDQEFVRDTYASLQGGRGILQQKDEKGELRIITYRSLKYN